MIILLGLQIFKVANQLINSSSGTELGLNTFPIPFFDNFLVNDNSLNSIDNKNRELRANNSNDTYFADKFDANNKLNDFSKRSGFYGPSNQSIPFDSDIREYSKSEPKPYPYSRGETNRDPNDYPYPNSKSDREDQKFNSYNIKPDWNEFEDSIDQSLNEPKSYYPNQQQLKSEDKREEDSDSTTPNDDNTDSFDTDYTESEYPPDLDPNDEDVDEDDTPEEENPDSAKYREEDTPDCAYGHSYCYTDDEYPEEWMRKAMDKQMDILTQILPESTETFDLVEGIPKEIDENYTYIDSPHDLYNSESSEQISYDNENELSYRDGGYICPSYVNYIKPKRALNNDGLWKVILNMNESYRGVDYNQHIRIEECVYERTKCSFAPNYYKSECIQKYSNERLLAWTPDKGIHLDVFRLPIACSCHLIPNK